MKKNVDKKWENTMCNSKQQNEENKRKLVMHLPVVVP